jgi:hypothetical protein
MKLSYRVLVVAGVLGSGLLLHCGGDRLGVAGHRPTAAACAATDLATVPPEDAGAVHCDSDSDCQGDGGNTFLTYCLRHVCSPDACLSDSDCVAGSACACASQGLELVVTVALSPSMGPPPPAGLGNFCIPSGCQVDADCASRLCSFSGGNSCTGLPGYQCRTAADTCTTNSDCPSSGGVGGGCFYDTTAGNWQCAPACHIAG